MLDRRALTIDFVLLDHLERTLTLLAKYRDLPMGLADACLVRMSEIAEEPLVLTTDQHFRIYRRSGRRLVPALLPMVG